MDLLRVGLFCVAGAEPSLNLLGTLHDMDYGGEVHEEGIADGLDDMAVVVGHRPLDELVMEVQQPQHPAFVAPHLAAEVHDVREHDRGQPSRLCGPRAGAFLCHGGDYRARAL